MDARTTVSIQQACTLVGVSRRSIYNWLRAGKLQWKRTAGGSIRIYVDSLWRERETATLAAATEAP